MFRFTLSKVVFVLKKTKTPCYVLEEIEVISKPSLTGMTLSLFDRGKKRNSLVLPRSLSCCMSRHAMIVFREGSDNV